MGNQGITPQWIVYSAPPYVDAADDVILYSHGSLNEQMPYDVCFFGRTLGEAWAQLKKSLADEAEVHLKFSSKVNTGTSFSHPHLTDFTDLLQCYNNIVYNKCRRGQEQSVMGQKRTLSH